MRVGRAVDLDVYMHKHLSLFEFTYAWKTVQWSKEENWSTSYFDFMVHERSHCNGGLNLTALRSNGCVVYRVCILGNDV